VTQLDALRGKDSRSRLLLETRLYDRRLLQVTCGRRLTPPLLRPLRLLRLQGRRLCV
jgi:hypothetical protein